MQTVSTTEARPGKRSKPSKARAQLCPADLKPDQTNADLAWELGFSDAQRDDPPAPGAWVVYQFNGLTPKGVPRFARFLRVREAVEG